MIVVVMCSIATTTRAQYQRTRCNSTQACIPTGGDCSTRGRSSMCEESTYEAWNYTVDPNTCICTPKKFYTPQLDQPCDPNDTPTAGPWICMLEPGTTQYTVYSRKTEGDSCSGEYDCRPPRLCVQGKCHSQLNIGDLCLNETSNVRVPTFLQSGRCPYNSVCTAAPGQSVADGDRVLGYCVPLANEGASCNRSSECVPWASCDNNNVCTARNNAWASAGQSVDSPSDCGSYMGVYNSTIMKITCLDYEQVHADFIAAGLEGQTCTRDSQCQAPNYPNYGGSCDCNGTTVARCVWKHSTPQQNLAAFQTQQRNTKAMYNAGCAWQNYFDPSSFSLSQDYCAVRAGVVTQLYTQCDQAKQRVAQGSLDCGKVELYCSSLWINGTGSSAATGGNSLNIGVSSSTGKTVVIVRSAANTSFTLSFEAIIAFIVLSFGFQKWLNYRSFA